MLSFSHTLVQPNVLTHHSQVSYQTSWALEMLSCLTAHSASLAQQVLITCKAPVRMLSGKPSLTPS